MMTSKTKTILLRIAAVLGLTAILYAIHWWLTRHDGYGPSGYFDDDGNSQEINNNQDMLYKTFAQTPVTLKHFNISEFDSPDQPGSGKNMRATTLLMIDDARGRADVPFHINSGFRTKKHNKEVGGVAGSAHEKGFAGDIATTTKANQRKIVKALYDAGFRRFGIGKNFVHADNDPNKPTPAVWFYEPLTTLPFDPFNL